LRFGSEEKWERPEDEASIPASRPTNERGGPPSPPASTLHQQDPPATWNRWQPLVGVLILNALLDPAAQQQPEEQDGVRFQVLHPSPVRITIRAPCRTIQEATLGEDLSPDTTSFPKSKSQKGGDSGEGNYEDGRAESRKESARQQRDKGHPDEELSDKEHNEGWESLIRELLDSVHGNSKHPDSDEPEGQPSIYQSPVCSNSALIIIIILNFNSFTGNGYDLSQKSICYPNIIPGYSQKSRPFKIHCQ